MHEYIIPKHQMQDVLSYIGLTEVESKQQIINKKWVRVSLYKYFSQIKKLILENDTFGGLKFLMDHPQLQSFFLDPTFDNSEYAIDKFAQM